MKCQEELGDVTEDGLGLKKMVPCSLNQDQDHRGFIYMITAVEAAFYIRTGPLVTHYNTVSSVLD